jgi:hypothetical protein
MLQNIPKDKILDIVKLGPTLPVKVAKQLGMGGDTVLVGAILSTLISSGDIKVSTLKVGGSPLYYIPDQESKLEDFLSYLNPKDQKVFRMLKESKILQDSTQDSLTRVALRTIKDFAKPFEIDFQGKKVLFWRFYVFSKDDALILAQKSVKAIIPIVEPIVQEPVVAPVSQVSVQPVQPSVSAIPITSTISASVAAPTTPVISAQQVLDESNSESHKASNAHTAHSIHPRTHVTHPHAVHPHVAHSTHARVAHSHTDSTSEHSAQNSIVESSTSESSNSHLIAPVIITSMTDNSASAAAQSSNSDSTVSSPVIAHEITPIETISSQPSSVLPLVHNKSKTEKNSKDFFELIRAYAISKNLDIINKEKIKKTEYDVILKNHETNEYIYCKAKDKSTINEGDLAPALIFAQNKKMPCLFITTGSLTPKAETLLTKEFSGLKFEKISA